MDDITISEVTNLDGSIIQWIQIDHGNEQFTLMLKSEYDRQQAEQSTPMVAGDE
jgi:hypothetical protein